MVNETLTRHGQDTRYGFIQIHDSKKHASNYNVFAIQDKPISEIKWQGTPRQIHPPKVR
jgi:hypothetical protein